MGKAWSGIIAMEFGICRESLSMSDCRYTFKKCLVDDLDSGYGNAFQGLIPLRLDDLPREKFQT